MNTRARRLAFAGLLLPCAAWAAPEGDASSALLGALQVAREAAQRVHARPNPAAVSGPERLEILREILVRTNRDYSARRLLVSSESQAGSEVLRRQAAETARGYDGVFGRYIGYAFAAAPLTTGAAVIRPGVQENKAVGGGSGRYSGPGIAAFELLTVGVKPTAYDAGVRRALVVEVAFDELESLFVGKTDAIEGTVRYYVRGAFDREVYDADTLQSSRERKRFYSPSLDLNNYLARFQELHRRDADDTETLAEERRIRDLLREASRFEENPGGRKLRVGVDRKSGTPTRDVLFLEFQD